jgi:mRNA interferase RelE/StbE
VEKYSLFIKPSAVKELERINKKDIRRITSRISALMKNPRPAGCEKLSGDDKLRLRQGNYRIVYSVDDSNKMILVVKIGHRREVYRNK